MRTPQLLFAALLVLCFSSFVVSIEYANQVQLQESSDKLANYFLYWNIVGDVIQIKITAQTTGWIGFGFAPTGTMVNSDVVIGWVSEDGSTFFDDRYAVQYSEPIRDLDMVPPGENNCQLLYISSLNGWTTIEYSRPLNTNDQWDVPVVEGEMQIVWAMGYENDNPSDGKISRHQYRAVNRVTFISSSGLNPPQILEPTCVGAHDRRFYTGDSSSLISLRLESIAGDMRISSGPIQNAAISVLESAYSNDLLSTIQTQYFSASTGFWAITSQRGQSSLSSPSTNQGPISGSPSTLNTTIGSNECVGTAMGVSLSNTNIPPTISAYTHQGNVRLHNVHMGKTFEIKTSAGIIQGVVMIGSESSLSIDTEWGEITLEIDRQINFEGKELIRIVLIGFSGSYNVETIDSIYKISVVGQSVTPITGGPTYESGYVGFQGQSSSINITSAANIELVFFHDSDTQTADIQINNFHVPTRRTSYICTNVELPSQEDSHIVRIDTIIDQPLVLHHMVLFVCNGPQPASEPWDCSSMDPECTEFLYVWAVGGSNFYLPEEAGFLMGPSGAQYAIMQIHYDNPDHLDNIWDSSGFRLYYTPNLRKYNAGILEVGVVDIYIPPGETNYQVGAPIFGCPSECSTKNIPVNSEITVFASMLHAHLAGTQILTEHWRPSGNGSYVQLDDLNNNPYYDFNVQSYDIFNPPKYILPGDALVTYCIYNTEDRQRPTTFGLSTAQEMCFNYIAYYPVGAWSLCLGYSDHFANCDETTATDMWSQIPARPPPQTN